MTFDADEWLREQPQKISPESCAHVSPTTSTAQWGCQHTGSHPPSILLCETLDQIHSYAEQSHAFQLSSGRDFVVGGYRREGKMFPSDRRKVERRRHFSCARHFLIYCLSLGPFAVFTGSVTERSTAAQALRLAYSCCREPRVFGLRVRTMFRGRDEELKAGNNFHLSNNFIAPTVPS